MNKKQLFLIFVFFIASTFVYSQSGNNIGPVVRFDGKSGGNITKIDMLKVDSLTVTGGTYSILSFTFSVSNEGKLKEINAISGKFSPKIKNLIASVTPGSKVYIENIKVLDKQTKKIFIEPSILFTIK